jgi:outer membrane protein insertion porin family
VHKTADAQDGNFKFQPPPACGRLDAIAWGRAQLKSESLKLKTIIKNLKLLTFKLWFCTLSFELLVFLGTSAIAQESGQAATEEQLSKMQIGSISTAGNLKIERNTILSKVRSREGYLFDPKTAADDVKRVATIPGVQKGWYNTKVADGKVELTFVVIEQNIVRAIEFAGNKDFKSSTLKKKLDFKKADYLDPTLAEAGSQKLLEHYQQKGYPFATVALDYEKLVEGKVCYTITEGKRVKIASITYSGNKQIKANDLKKITKLRKTKFIFWPVYYNEQDIQKEIANLLNGYYKRGFLNIAVECEKKFNSDKSRVDLAFKINEGQVYSVRNIAFVGNKEFDAVSLSKVLKTVAGKVYDKLASDADAKQLTKEYLENGFIDATVEQNLKFVDTNKVDVEYVIREGEHFRIGQIEITGNKQTQDRVIRRILDEYDFRPGNFYNADIARGDGSGSLEKIIKGSTYMEAATIKPSGEKPDRKDAMVNVVEGKTGQIMAGAGISADSGVVGQIVFDERNFNINGKPENLWDVITGRAYKGAGQNLRISLEPGTLVSQYSISFTEPYLNDKPVSMNLTGASWKRFWESYDEERLKGFVEFEKRYKNRWNRSIGFRLENVDVSGFDDDAPKEIRDVKGDNLLASVRLGLGRNLTDDRFNPSSGYTFDVGYEQVGGDFIFGKLNGTYQRFYTLSTDLADRKTTLSTKLYGATTIGDAPPFEKYYAGGSGTYYGIRGFQYRGVSRRGTPSRPDGSIIAGAEKNDPIGSDWIALANAEVAVPLIGDNISWLIFVDTGFIDTGGPRASAGTGIQILIPQWFGPVPMRFELSAPFMKESDDRTQVFSFSIGRLF